MNFQTPNIILTYFPAFAGGKFVINSLSLSRHCIIADPRYALQDLAYTQFDSDYYAFKIQSILSSLPPMENKTNWRFYEFKEWMFAGIDNNEYGKRSLESLRAHQFSSMLDQTINSGRYHCFLSHYHNVALGFKSVWSNAKIVSLVNWKKFIKIAGAFKLSPGEDIDRHLDYLLDFPSTLPWPSLIYDVDHNMFCRKNHLRSIQTLYQALGWDDFNSDLVGRYYDEYRYLHGF